MIKAVAARGWQSVKLLLEEDTSFQKNTVKSVGDADTLARKAANTFSAMGDYSQLSGDLTGYTGLHGAGTALHNLGQSIHNVRRGALANRVKSDFEVQTLLWEVSWKRKWIKNKNSTYIW